MRVGFPSAGLVLYLAVLTGTAVAAGLAADPPAASAEAPAPPERPAAPALLQDRLDALTGAFDGDAGVAVLDLQKGWMAEVRGEQSLPQQSVAKLWTAIAVLDAVDEGRLGLDGEIGITRADLSVFHEPLAARVGRGGYRASVGELLRLAIVHSDNAANDILVRAVGGTAAVREVIAGKGIDGVSAGVEQRVLQGRIAGLQWGQDYSSAAGFLAARARTPQDVRQAALDAYLARPMDGAQPAAIARALEALYRGRLLSPGSTELLLDLMAQTVFGHDRLMGGLPSGWRISHKTGTGPVLQGFHAGENDVGVVTAPDGRAYAVVVLIGRTHRSEAAGEALMRQIARAVVEQWRSGA